MADKFTPVTDPAEIAELEANDDISKPFAHKPNGHLWVDLEELKQWRALRQGAMK
jgi:hypothetical protein